MKLSNMQCHSLFDKGTHEQRSRVKPVRLGHGLVRGCCFARGDRPLFFVFGMA